METQVAKLGWLVKLGHFNVFPNLEMFVREGIGDIQPS